MGNISVRPNDPYDLGTMGVIHSSKYREICRLVLEQRDTISQDLAALLAGHRLEGVLENMEIDEVADFIRHVALINKRSLGWEFIDDVNYKLNKIFTPRWELPNLGFDNGFREIFLTRVTWEPPKFVRGLIVEFLELYPTLTNEKLEFKWQENIETLNIWNYRDLFLLLNEVSYISSEFGGEIEAGKFTPLINHLKILFEENYKNRLYTIPQRLSLIFLFVKSTIRSDTIDYNQIQILMDSSYSLIKQLDGDLQKSFRLISGYTYAIFAYHLFHSTSDLVIQRDLIADLLQDIYKPEEVDLDYWSRHLATSKPHPLLMSIILSAYFRLTKMLYQYAEALPESDNRFELIRMYTDLMSFLHKTSIHYLEVYFGVNLSNVDPKNLVQTLHKHIKFPNLKRVLFEILIDTQKTVILNKQSHEVSEEEIDGYQALVEQIHNETIALVHTLDIKLRQNLYNFDVRAEKILSEFQEQDSIILCGTFEDEVIQIIGKIFSEVQDSLKRRNEINIEDYEIVLLFITNWIQHLYQYPDLRYESLMILSPIVSICYIQVSRGYYERNNLEGAYLAYFNSHYIVEMINTELILSQSARRKETQLLDKFMSIIKEWDIDYIVDTDYIKRITTNIDLKIRDRMTQRSDKSFSMGGMLADEIVIGYLDYITKIETFLQLVNEKENSIKDVITQNEIYEWPELSSLFRNDHLGSLYDPSNNAELFPFPIFRNMNAYAMAIKLYPIDVNLPGALLDIESIFQKISK